MAVENLRKAESKEHNCITCSHCKVFEKIFSEYQGTCELQFNGPVKPTMICNEYLFEEKIDPEARRILDRAW